MDRPPPAHLARNVRPPRAGLTIVEVIVIVGILAILLAILLPAVVAVSQRAKTTYCAANLRTLAGSLQAYAVEHGGLFPINVNSRAGGRYWYDRERIGRYAGNAFRHESGKNGGGVMRCPADDDGAQRSYGMNVWASADTDAFRFNDRSRGKLWRRAMREPEKVILLSDAWSFTGSPWEGWFATAVVGYYGTTRADRFGAPGATESYDGGRFGSLTHDLPYVRHRRSADGSGHVSAPVGRVNIAFADGHVELLSNADLFDAQTGRVTRTAPLWSPLDLVAPVGRPAAVPAAR
jgi:prepilin-type processing-associated H-X9-DG protein